MLAPWLDDLDNAIRTSNVGNRVRDRKSWEYLSWTYHMMCKDITTKMWNHAGLEGSLVGAKQLDIVATSTRSHFMHTMRRLCPFLVMMTQTEDFSWYQQQLVHHRMKGQDIWASCQAIAVRFLFSGYLTIIVHLNWNLFDSYWLWWH